MLDRISKDQDNSNTWSKTYGEGVEDAELCYACTGVDRSGRSGDSGDRRVCSGDSRSGLMSSRKRNSK